MVRALPGRQWEVHQFQLVSSANFQIIDLSNEPSIDNTACSQNNHINVFMQTVYGSGIYHH